MKTNSLQNQIENQSTSQPTATALNGQGLNGHAMAQGHTPKLTITKVKAEPKPKSSEQGNQPKTTLCIRNMVSVRCKMVVKALLENLDLPYTKVELGEVEILGKLPKRKREQLRLDLAMCKLELVEDHRNILVEKIKTAIIEMIHYSDERPIVNYSEFLSQKLNYGYTYLSNLFKEIKGTSIQNFIIMHKIERVKELLVCHDLTLSEIAWKLHYSSLAHLSNQFKKTTGLSPTEYMSMKRRPRLELDLL